MNKSDFVSAYAQQMRISKAEAEKHVKCFFEIIKDSLQKGEKVNFTGFGQFKVNERQARQVRNPQTGELIQVDKKNVPSFAAGAELKKAVNS